MSVEGKHLLPVLTVVFARIEIDELLLCFTTPHYTTDVD
jgi:hypothetical protein